MTEATPEEDDRAVTLHHETANHDENSVESPANAGDRVAHRSRFSSLTYSGPLPPASELQAYEDACPGLAREIAGMAVREQQHRHQLETKEQDANIANVKTLVQNDHHETTRGQFLAFGVIVLILATAAYGFFLGYPLVAGVLGGSTMLSVVALFLRQKLSTRNSSDEGFPANKDEHE